MPGSTKQNVQRFPILPDTKDGAQKLGKKIGGRRKAKANSESTPQTKYAVVDGIGSWQYRGESTHRIPIELHD